MNIVTWMPVEAEFDEFIEFTGETFASFEDYVNRVEEVVRDLLRRGKVPELKTVPVAQMRRYLIENFLQNTSENRAQAIALMQTCRGKLGEGLTLGLKLCGDYHHQAKIGESSIGWFLADEGACREVAEGRATSVLQILRDVPEFIRDTLEKKEMNIDKIL